MHIRVFHHDVAENIIVIIADVFIMVAGNIDHLRSMPCLAQYLLDDGIVVTGPIYLLGERPKINDVPHQIKLFALVMLEEIQQDIGLALAGTDVQIGNPDGSIGVGGHGEYAVINSAVVSFGWDDKQGI